MEKKRMEKTVEQANQMMKKELLQNKSSDRSYENSQVIDGRIEGGFIKSGSIHVAELSVDHQIIDRGAGGKMVSTVSDGEKGSRITQTKDSISCTFDGWI